MTAKNAHIQPTPAAEKEADAQAAKVLLDNPMLHRCLQEIEQQYTDEWKKTEGPHSEYRERAYFMVKAIDRLKMHIAEYATTNKLNRQRVKEHMQEK